MMKSKSTPILFHIIGCTIFLSLPIIFWPGEGGISEFFGDDRAIRGYLNNILILIFFYLIYYFLIPKFYFQKKYLIFTLIILLCYLVVVILPALILPFDAGHGPSLPGTDFKTGSGHRPMGGYSKLFFRLGHNLVFFLAVVFFSLMLKINNRWKLTEKEKLKAELSYFKAQINPHFLFNTLNTIYSLAIQKAANTPEAVVKLSGMMRYVLSDASADFVPLEKEISYISDYIELQKIRFGETVTIDYKPCDAPSGTNIAPLILIPFIENAFKFGVNPAENSNIGVSISLSGRELHLNVINHKVYGREETEDPAGLGIANAKRRMELLYPEKHRLVIRDEKDDFHVDLFITL